MENCVCVAVMYATPVKTCGSKDKVPGAQVRKTGIWGNMSSTLCETWTQGEVVAAAQLPCIVVVGELSGSPFKVVEFSF